MRLFSLTPRLEKIADLVPHASKVWDVGTDHGKLVVWLLQNDKIAAAIASDIGEEPLNAARKTAEQYIINQKLQSKIDFICCDGLNSPTPQTADTVVVAGMGGDTIISILQNADLQEIKATKLILQPMTAIEELRSYLYSGSYTVTKEYIVAERTKLYTIIEVEVGGVPEKYDLADTRIGKYTEQNEHYSEYKKKETNRLRNELNGTRIPREQILEAIKKLEDK